METNNKLREALVKAQTALVICEWPDGTRMEGVAELLRQIDAALSAPPRNCDRFATADEAIGAYRQTHKHMVVNVFLDWLFATATEKRGADK